MCTQYFLSVRCVEHLSQALVPFAPISSDNSLSEHFCFFLLLFDFFEFIKRALLLLFLLLRLRKSAPRGWHFVKRAPLSIFL